MLSEVVPRKLRWSELQVSMKLQGRVVREMDFGFFLEIGAPATGLLRKRNMPRDLDVRVGSCLTVFLASALEDSRRIDLALRPKLSQKELEAKAADASEVLGLVAAIQPYGVFVDIGACTAGLVHVSRMGSLDVSQCQVGHEVQVQISSLEPRLQLSIRKDKFVAPVVVKQPRCTVSLFEDTQSLPGVFAVLPKSVVTRLLLHGCNLADLAELARTSKGMQSFSQEASNIFWDLQGLCCFHTRVHFDEADTVLGVGVAIIEEGGRKHLTCDFDPISRLAFKELGVRKGIWRNAISYWLPLAIDAQHFARASSSLHKSLQLLGTGKIAEQTRSFGRQAKMVEPEAESFDAWLERRAKASEAANKKFRAFLAGTKPEVSEPKPKASKLVFEPSLVLDVLPKLMNSQVVLLMKGEVWASHKALNGYIGFHHLLLAICRSNPAVQQEVEGRIGRFIANDESRVKSKVPNLGEFICLLSASEKYGWQSVAAPLLGEVFDRNVLWLLKRYPHLGDLTDVGVSEDRLRCTFEAALVSMRLVMFNVWFLNNIAKPHDLCQATLQRYERTKGLPPRQQIEAVHRAVRQICEVNSWGAYFDAVGIERVQSLELCRWLRESVGSSLRKGYHRRGYHSRQPRPRADQHDEYEHLADKLELN